MEKLKVQHMCGIARDMAPLQPQRAGGYLASHHEEKGKHCVSRVLAFSRPLCLLQPCSIFTYYRGSFPGAAPFLTHQVMPRQEAGHSFSPDPLLSVHSPVK